MVSVEILDAAGSVRHVPEEMNFDLEVQGLAGYDIHAGLAQDVFFVMQASIQMIKFCDFTEQPVYDQGKVKCKACPKDRYTFYPGMNCRSCKDLLQPEEQKRAGLLCFLNLGATSVMNKTAFFVSISIAVQLLLILVVVGIFYKHRHRANI